MFRDSHDSSNSSHFHPISSGQVHIEAICTTRLIQGGMHQTSYGAIFYPSPPNPLSPSIYTKAARTSYFLTSPGCFVARNLTSSINFSRVASLSWPAGVGAIVSARTGRRVGVREIIVGLDSWSMFFSEEG